MTRNQSVSTSTHQGEIFLCDQGRYASTNDLLCETK